MFVVHVFTRICIFFLTVGYCVIAVSNSFVTMLRDHEAARVNTLFSLPERDRNYRVLLDPKFLCRFGLSSSQGEMSQLKRKTPADAQRKLVRLAYEKKTNVQQTFMLLNPNWILEPRKLFSWALVKKSRDSYYGIPSQRRSS
ncbi:hypothetical protein LWI28_005089 [Acer negundo]|uniref:Uncharacterized protein n=1 Tax=Acer negundo TaxID=4023 RepID=A0AAD5J2Z3_ACENE|nr:hypothetical protein LWI28_005089 [Acer negundo]